MSLLLYIWDFLLFSTAAPWALPWLWLQPPDPAAVGGWVWAELLAPVLQPHALSCLGSEKEDVVTRCCPRVWGGNDDWDFWVRDDKMLFCLPRTRSVEWGELSARIDRVLWRRSQISQQRYWFMHSTRQVAFHYIFCNWNSVMWMSIGMNKTLVSWKAWICICRIQKLLHFHAFTLL